MSNFKPGDTVICDLGTVMEILGTESDNCDKSRIMYRAKMNGRIELWDVAIVEKYYTKR